MSQWKNTSDSANAVEWVASSLHQGSGKTAIAANNTALVVNTTPGAILDAGIAQNIVIGQFPVTSWAKANTTGESTKVHGSGWALRRAFEGPVIGMTAANGSSFANGETVVLTGGSVTGVANLTTNATGNLVSATIETGNGFFPNGASATLGLFPNTSSITVTFTRELHVANLNVTGTDSNIGHSNVVNIVISANSVDTIPYGLNAIATVTSNSTGFISNTQTQAITWQGNGAAADFWGLFSNACTNTSVIITFTNANGAPITGLTASANLVTSTGGAVAVSSLGGRAGRVTYEMLAVMSPYSLANGGLANSTNGGTTQLPQ